MVSERQAEFDQMFAAIDAAESKARANHESGACRGSEWSCSFCEAECSTSLGNPDVPLRAEEGGFRNSPSAEPDDWCREESCRYRHWRSGSMPTHRRGADCPPAISPPASEASPTCDLPFGDGYTCDLPEGHDD